jgi:hypothetical protein
MCKLPFRAIKFRLDELSSIHTFRFLRKRDRTSEKMVDGTEKRNDLVNLFDEIQEILGHRRYQAESNVSHSIDEANELFQCNSKIENTSSLSMVLQDIELEKRRVLVSRVLAISLAL